MSSSPHDLRRPIDRGRILVVEGMDEFSLTIWLLEHMEIPGVIDIRPPYQDVAPLGEYLAEVLVPTAGFSDVQTVGVLRDAEEGEAAWALESVSQALARAFPGAPTLQRSGEFQDAPFRGRQIRVGVFIAPDGRSPGMLEDLCLSPQPIQEDPLLRECVSAYSECLGEHGVSRPDWAKRRLHAYLASQPRPGLLLGQAAEAGYWHFDDPVWAPLKQFLRDLAGQA